MFTALIDTPPRTKIATFFLSTRARSFHPEEIRKAVAEPGSMVVSTLRHLAKGGFLKSSERRGEIYYRLNPRYPYLDELTGFLVKKPFRFKDMVWLELERLNNTNLVVLTGIFTGQGAMPTDMVVVGNPSQAVLKRIIERIEKEMRFELNYTVFSNTEFEDRVNMYERFTRDLFDNPHLIVLDRRNKNPKPKTIQIKPKISKK